MWFKNEAFCFIVLHLSVFIVYSAGDLEIKIPSNRKINPVPDSHFDERKISKRYNEPDFQTCFDNFEIHHDKIIRTQDSRAMGARYINERDVPSREDCLRLCCETSDCDVFVFEERSPGSCYLFQCGTPEEFKCKFTKHRNYTSAVLGLNKHMTELESQIKLTKHEHELTNLRQTDSLPTSILPVSNTASTLLSDNKETEQLVPSSSNNNSANNNRRCSRYQFECRSSEECIAIYNACDGIPQCSDGSDEAPELGCPALSMTTITPVDKVNQGEVPENLSMHNIASDSLSQSMSSSKHQHMHQSVPVDIEQQLRHGNKEYNPETWMKQSAGYRSNEQGQSQQHHHHHQELQLEQRNQQLHQQQLQEHEQQHQQQQRLRQQQLQNQEDSFPESRQQKLQPQPEHQQIQQTQMQQQVLSEGNYVQPNNGIQSQQMLTMSPQQNKQLQTQTAIQQQTQQLDNIQPPQQLINQAKLYGREGEGLLYHSPSAADSLHWSPSSNSYQQEQSQENVAYRSPNSGMSQIFNHKGNSLVSQSERYRLQNHMYLSKAIAMEGGVGNQFADTLPNEYSRYNNYFDNSQYNRVLPHSQQNGWQNVHKPIHEMSQMDDSIGGPHEGEAAVPSGLNGMAPDYYYEESMRNKLQQQLLAQQRLLPQNNMPLNNEDQLLQGQYKDLKIPAHEEITLDHVNHELPSTGLAASVKKASAYHPSSTIVTTEKPKETKVHHHGQNSHRKMEQLSAEVTLKETNFDGINMQQAGSPSGAILSLTLGMCVTAVMIVLVGCRMKTVRRRMRRGSKSAYAHDADFLVNGMYL